MSSRPSTTDLLDESLPILGILSITAVFVGFSGVVADISIENAEEFGHALTWIFATTGLALVLMYVISRAITLAHETPATPASGPTDESE